MGPAGCGKSTYVKTMRRHCENARRSVHVVNLDPAAEHHEEDQTPSVDIKDLITVDEVMESLNFGPNGGLVYAMEYLLDHIDWLEDELGDYEDDYLFIDCPGQIELYSHMTIMRRLAQHLEQMGYRVCAVYMIDSQFLFDNAKFLGGALSALSAMIRLEITHINVLTKVDLIPKRMRKSRKLEQFLELDVITLEADLDKEMGPKYRALNHAICSLLEDFSMVNFVPLDITSTQSIFNLLQMVDMSIQYGEDLDVKEPKEGNEDDEHNHHDHDH
eukprot:TRINITY_DN15927_c0_g2_i1.p1 TRINITY_DN15927_c0_g2~~TRINITY_DN15927_c0_g2_i1.p1  ORF type:complete len:286 (+),score=56.90 TRINITY_DN15927_c0_g2_i1:41-859(+)